MLHIIQTRHRLPVACSSRYQNDQWHSPLLPTQLYTSPLYFSLLLLLPFPSGPILPIPPSIHILILRRPTRDILPSSTEPPPRAGQQALFLLRLGVLVRLVHIQFRRPEQAQDEDNQKDSQEGDLSPKVDDAEEGEIDRDAVHECADDARGADVARLVRVGELGAGAHGAVVVRAVGLVGGVVGFAVAVGLGAEVGVLRGHYHGGGVVDGEDHEGEQFCCQEQSLWGCLAFPDGEDFKPEEADADGGDADDGAAEEVEGEEEEEDVVYGEDFGGFDEDPVGRVED